MTTSTFSGLLRALPLLALLLVVGGLRAQEGDYYTLSNGTLRWLLATGSDTVPEDITRFRTVQGDRTVEYDTFAVPGGNYTLETRMGDVLLALDTTTPASPTVKPVAAADWSPLCVWRRTGYTGYYYQEHNGYRYYLVGSKGSLSVSRFALGTPVTLIAKFYNWDFGASITDITYRNGKRTESYYWIEYSPFGATLSDGQWTMSGHTYARPESPLIIDDPVMPKHTFCDAVVESVDGSGDTTWTPSGSAAVYLPVDIIDHPREAVLPEGKGLTGVALQLDDGSAATSPLAYGDHAFVVPTLVAGSGDKATVTERYREYRVETGRRGMSLRYGAPRETPGFGGAGLATSQTYYYWSSDEYTTLRSTPPSPSQESLVELNREFDITRSAARLTSLTRVNAAGVADPNGANLRIDVTEVPPAGMTAWVYVTVNYTNGTSQSDSILVHFSNYVDTKPFSAPVHAPVVKGNVFGGGRIANVSGNTAVTVHSVDSVRAVYGGNDIAGWVQGDTGATMQIGTAKTNADHAVHIGWVYGGGCGLYTYQGINPSVIKAADGVTDSLVDPYLHSGNTRLGYQAYYFNGRVYPWASLPADYDHYAALGIANADTSQYAKADWTATPVVDARFQYTPYWRCSSGEDYDPSVVDQTEDGNGGACMADDDKLYLGTIPYIKKAKITVGTAGGDTASNNHIVIDSLFGGAENAFIGVTAATPVDGVTVDIHGGTIFAAFGGNNYGGSVAKTSMVTVNVHDTKHAPDGLKDIHNTYFTSYGRDFGIRHLFGGGNLVDGSHAVVNILGGMLDTVFLGGNSATVDRPIGTVNCADDKFIFVNDSITSQWVGGSLVERPLYDASKPLGHRWDNYDSLINQRPDRFDSETGRYNVRVLFGGNNRAAMNTMSTIFLQSGGISLVYGGGNAGDMRNRVPINEMGNPIIRDSIKVAMAGWGYQRPYILGSLVHSVPGSRIIVEQLYGGCRMANVYGSSAAWLSGGVFGYVHGGNDISGDVGTESRHPDDDSLRFYSDGTYTVIDRQALVLQDAYGGSDGFYHCSDKGRYRSDAPLVNYNGKPYDPYDEYWGLLVPTHNSTNLFLNGGTVLFSAYGGGVKAHVGYPDVVDKPQIMIRDSNLVRDLNVRAGIQRGAIRVQVGLPPDTLAIFRDTASGVATDRLTRLASDDAANQQAWLRYARTLTQPVVGSATHHGVSPYGDGNAYGGGYLSYLYGCAQAYVAGESHIFGSLYAGNDCMGSINSFGYYEAPRVPVDQFVASNGDALNWQDLSGTWNASYDTYLLIQGKPRIGSVYGSGNGDYDYNPATNGGIGPVCHDEYVEQRPLQSKVFIDINTAGGFIDTVFGGGNGTGVSENVMILFNSQVPDATLASVDSAFIDYPLSPVHYPSPDRKVIGGTTVGTIFGGNNRDEMLTCVPDIVLHRGKVRNIFGGGNSGNMGGSKAFADVCGDSLFGVSTHVLVESDSVTITDSLFGGCRKADVYNMAFIEIRQTQASGINYVYGGNDISGSVYGNTRIDISGDASTVNNIYGGSNGRYDYVSDDNINFDVYAFGHSPSDPLIASGTTGRPRVDSTTVNIFGGTINNNVYGGGSLGDCRATRVEVNDRACSIPDNSVGVVINGSVFGGGEGNWQHLADEHLGNVFKAEGSADSLAEGSTYVHLVHAHNVSTATVYGGGRGGDVDNTYIKVYPEWDQPFAAIYGGCWGSDVNGLATLDLYGSDLGGALNSHFVYGGNDYTGNVYSTRLNVYSGRYDTIFGASNGDYDYQKQPWTGAGIDLPGRDSLPNTEYVEINFHQGTVEGFLYGGGNCGTSFVNRRNASGEIVHDADGFRIPDTAQAKGADFDDPTRYSHIVVNVHGGTFEHSIFAGAHGKDRPLVYGLKVLNMDGDPIVRDAVYGGSERVSDGYWNECDSALTADRSANTDRRTTLRPSSIVNVAGGSIRTCIYGGGYQGNIYGSVYVNVGLQAVEHSRVWQSAYGQSPAGAYAIFKPGATSGPVLAPALVADHISVGRSVYGGANWGNNDGNFDFRVPGFFGGESRILVDGQDYNTAYDMYSVLPSLDIAHSIIGSGTSVQGGDVYNRIDVENYGAIRDCHPTKDLRSIQRTHAVYLHNSAIHYTGATDAAGAYPSQQFTINRADTVNVIGYNVIELDAVMTEVRELNFYNDTLQQVYLPRHRRALTPTPNLPLLLDHSASMCDDHATVCAQIAAVDPVTAKHAALVVDNGVNVDILTEDHVYGTVNGFAYLMAEEGTNAVVTARPKHAVYDGGLNVSDGGFMAACDTSNLIPAYGEGTSILWTDGSTPASQEFPFNNYRHSYRVWSIGQGLRTRFAVILAHAQPEILQDTAADNFTDKYVKLVDPSDPAVVHNLALAHAELVLPPTLPGNYYRLGAEGITIDDDNSAMRLIDMAWHPLNWDTVNRNGGHDYDTSQVEQTGRWDELTSLTGTLMGVDFINANPESTFGLLMASGRNFARSASDSNVYIAPASYSGDWDINQGSTVVNGNSHVNITQNYYSAQVGEDQYTSPIMDLYLTYNPNFSTTMLGSVSFTLDEYTKAPRRYPADTTASLAGRIWLDGSDTVWVDSSLNQKVQVSVTIATLLEKFKDMEFNMLAMYNEGRSYTFNRKAVLPATLHARKVYLDSVAWWPSRCTGVDNFNLTGQRQTIFDAPEANVFRLGIQPVDNISSTLTTAVGWNYVEVDTAVDVYSEARHLTALAPGATAPFSAVSGGSATCDKPDVIRVGSAPGLELGELDGRGLAAFNLSLDFDGNRVYPDTVVGHADLYIAAIGQPGDTSRFKIRLNVLCRPRGDTIFIASADSIERCGITLHPGRLIDYDANENPKVGKEPRQYLQNFQDAFNSVIYREGDVIAILDTLKVTDGLMVNIRGVEYSAVPVIRYSGHHHDLPGECGVYRGTMIDVSGPGSVFTASSIDFSGSALAHVEPPQGEESAYPLSTYPHYWDATINNGHGANDPSKRLDTNVAYGPIIAVHDGASVKLYGGTSVHDNFNVDSTGSRSKGAVSVTNGGTLRLQNNVTFEHNFVPDFGVGYPLSGALVVDDGRLTLMPSHEASQILIADNFKLGTLAAQPTFWTAYNDPATGNLVRYVVDTANLSSADNFGLRNVYLTRTPDAVSPITADHKTSWIDLPESLAPGTRIGVSKWFPGPNDRDTIFFAVGVERNDLNAVRDSANFFSDEGFNILYNYDISSRQMFLHRCATFRHQLALNDDNSPRYIFNTASTLKASDVLSYLPLADATCPTGGDTIVYRVNGGFFPYSYTWTDNNSGDVVSRLTSKNNNTIRNEVAAGNYAGIADASADTFYTPHVEMTPAEHSAQLSFSVQADDFSGFCSLSKDIEVSLVKFEHDTLPFVPVEVGGKDGWVDTASVVETSRVLAKGERYYRAIRVTPYVRADRTYGTILAKVDGDPAVYRELYDVSPLTGADTVYRHELADLLFCEGNIIRLATTPKDDSKHGFIMWDFDPYYAPQAKYIVPSDNTDVIAYYGPRDYWKDTVTSGSAITNPAGVSVAHLDSVYDFSSRQGHSYVTTYNGDVHIYDEYGLAWFISVVNGLNGTQARPFYFNRVFLHRKLDASGNQVPYDMRAHLWTPVGTQQYGFRGRFIGVEGSRPGSHDHDADTTRLPQGQRVVVRNIIVNEPTLQLAGFFGNLDTARVDGISTQGARVSGIELESAFVRGGQYVGGLAGRSVGSIVTNVAVTAAEESADNTSTSILTTHYVSGGLIGLSVGDTIRLDSLAVKYVGDAVYSGGIVGYATSAVMDNNSVRNNTHMSGLYVGGVAGYLNGEAPTQRRALFRHKGPGRPSVVRNNYVRLTSDGRAQRVGGLVGTAENTIIENNYAYGPFQGAAVTGGVAGVAGSGTQVDHSYFASASAPAPAGSGSASAFSDVASFSGKGNQVVTSQPVDGVDNLTRLLNRWVRQANAQGGDYRYWRSDLASRNGGYPLFGQPDLIPVTDSLLLTGCDEVEWEGFLFRDDDVMAFHMVDSVEMVDSTVVLTVRLGHSQLVALSDSASVGDDYDGYGFHVSAAETLLLQRTLDSLGHASLTLSDTLAAASGCDSVVVLTLHFVADTTEAVVQPLPVADVRIFPNPTTSLVHVEAAGLSQVELFDNEGRRLEHFFASSPDAVTIDLSRLPAGVYYFRVHTPQSVTIQKVIKR